MPGKLGRITALGLLSVFFQILCEPRFNSCKGEYVRIEAEGNSGKQPSEAGLKDEVLLLGRPAYLPLRR